jgi:hypothetical protein
MWGGRSGGANAVDNVYLAKVTGKNTVGLMATDAESEAVLNKFGDGEVALWKPVRLRSYQWHKMYFGICADIGQNQDPARDADSVDYELRALAGHYNPMKARKGNELYEVRIPKRIAFDKLTADEWAALWPSLELAGRERFGDEYFDRSGRL